MPLAIWKYPLMATDTQTFVTPKDSRILSVAEQRDDIVLYALVDTEETERDTHTVWIVGTGHAVPEQTALSRFLGTVNLQGGALMFHVFVK